MLTIVASLAGGTIAFGAPVVAVTDPDGTTFTGTYNKGDTDGDGIEESGTQQGYVGVYNNGVVACNGNPETLKRPDDGTPLVGYIWIGSGQAASNRTAADPSGNIGAGNNHEDASGNPTGNSPCPDADPQGVNEG
jgi:hypothetical protein